MTQDNQNIQPLNTNPVLQEEHSRGMLALVGLILVVAVGYLFFNAMRMPKDVLGEYAPLTELEREDALKKLEAARGGFSEDERALALDKLNNSNVVRYSEEEKRAARDRLRVNNQ